MDEIRQNNLRDAFCQFLNPTINSNGILRVTHGPNFSRFGSYFVWFLLLFFLISVGVFALQHKYFISLSLILVSLVTIIYIIDLRGIEFDTKLGKIRSYSSFGGIRTGVWHPINNFKLLKIYEDTILEKREISSGYDTHRFYSLYLINDDKNCLIKLHEHTSITQLRIFSSKFSQVSGLEFLTKIEKRNPEIINY